MNKDEYEKAASFWTEKEAAAVKIDCGLLKTKIEEFLKNHTTCAFAAGTGDTIRCTPIEYSYLNGAFYLMSEGGLKFRALENSSHVSLAVYDAFTGFGSLNGLQVTGTADIIGSDTTEYADVLAYKKIPAQAIKKLTHPMYMIKVTPSRFDMLCSDFKKQGFDVRQSLVL